MATMECFLPAAKTSGRPKHLRACRAFRSQLPSSEDARTIRASGICRIRPVSAVPPRTLTDQTYKWKSSSTCVEWLVAGMDRAGSQGKPQGLRGHPALDGVGRGGKRDASPGIGRQAGAQAGLYARDGSRVHRGQHGFQSARSRGRGP